MREFAAIITGDEVLNCTVNDENGFWLCNGMNSLGFFTREIIFLRDDIYSISSHIKRLISSGIDIIIITGGLGPTYDDMTLRAMAKATDRSLKINKQALEMVKERYEFLYENGIVKEKSMNRYREKMAILPEGSIPIRNPNGAAPGIMIKEKGTLIFALPGVPSEMKRMFDEEVKAIIEKELGIWAYNEKHIFLDHRDESTIAEILEEISKRHDVYIKSRAGIINNEKKMVITLASRAENEEEAREKIKGAMDELYHLLKEKNIQFHDH